MPACHDATNMTPMVSAPCSRTFRPPHPTDVRLTLRGLARGSRDPSIRFRPDGMWRATRTPMGPGTERITSDGATVTVEAWGPGADWLVGAAPALLGAADSHDGFVARHPIVADAHRRFAGLRIARSQAVMEALVPAIIEQKVVGKAAKRSWTGLVRRFGEPAPGPPAVREMGLLLPPDPRRLAGLPSWAFHPFNIERKRADTIRTACDNAARLEEASAMTAGDAALRLTAMPGVGRWTAAVVGLVALGDADAVPVGDFHMKNVVAWNLVGKPRGTDDEMLELLEPYRGHRGRALTLLMLAGATPPRYGPRLEINAIAAL
jgi:3-methyladenine DNA glycosylase/8-oxoguanine DNA glycosylase